MDYLLPFFAATVVATGRWGLVLRPWPAAASIVALTLALTRPFPLPTALDEATARFFDGFTQEVQRRTGGPLLVTRPDLVYFLAGQPAEIEGSSFRHLAAGGAPGPDGVLRGLEERRYALVVWTWPLPDSPEWTGALLRGYARVGECRLAASRPFLAPRRAARPRPPLRPAARHALRGFREGPDTLEWWFGLRLGRGRGRGPPMPSTHGSPALTPARAAALAFLAAAATLFVQVLVHRMVSAKLLNNYAFLVISLTMLGFAVSGVLLTRVLGRCSAGLDGRPHFRRAGFVSRPLAVSVGLLPTGAGDQFAVTPPAS